MGKSAKNCTCCGKKIENLVLVYRKGHRVFKHVKTWGKIIIAENGIYLSDFTFDGGLHGVVSYSTDKVFKDNTEFSSELTGIIADALERLADVYSVQLKKAG